MILLKQLTVVAISLLVVLKGNLVWGECDCTDFPFKPDPPCFNKCWVRFLETVPAGEVAMILRLDQMTVAKIKSLPSSGKGEGPESSLEDYKQVLSPTEFDLLNTRLRSLSPEQIDAVLAAMRKKKG